MQITCNTSSAHHVQHFVHHVLQRDSSAIKFDRVEIAFILVLFYCKVRTVLTGAYRFVDLGKSEIRPYRSLDLGNRSVQIEVKSL